LQTEFELLGNRNPFQYREIHGVEPRPNERISSRRSLPADCSSANARLIWLRHRVSWARIGEYTPVWPSDCSWIVERPRRQIVGTVPEVGILAETSTSAIVAAEGTKWITGLDRPDTRYFPVAEEAIHVWPFELQRNVVEEVQYKAMSGVEARI